MFTVNDTFTQNSITYMMLIADKSGIRVFLFDSTGKRSVLDPQHYAGIFSGVFDTAEIEQHPVVVRFTLVDGCWWRMRTAPCVRIDRNAAYAAFIEALNYPD